MSQSLVLVIAGVAIAAALTLLLGAGRLVGSRAGRLAMLAGALLLPGVALLSGVDHAYRESSTTTFCLSCHEMGDHGKSLFVDDPLALPAVHYQKRLIDRDHACFQCHTDYALYGDVRAKMNGLRHVWVHFLEDPPAKLELYAPYPNANCLHCHDDARSFLEARGHDGIVDVLRTEERSCLECHSRGHALDAVKENAFWIGG
jgi:cytochrome c-type protein NapC